MAGITLADAEAHLATWLAAETAIATSQSYTITSGESTRTLTRADLSKVREQIEYWQKWVDRLSPTNRRRTRYVVPG